MLEKVKSKSDLGLNGGHRLLGNEISNSEFKGFVVSEIRHIKETIRELKPRIANNEKVLWIGGGVLIVIIIVLRVVF